MKQKYFTKTLGFCSVNLCYLTLLLCSHAKYGLSQKSGSIGNYLFGLEFRDICVDSEYEAIWIWNKEKIWNFMQGKMPMDPDTLLRYYSVKTSERELTVA